MHSPHFKYQSTGLASGLIFDGNEPVAEILDLQLCNVRLRPGGGIIIGDNVGMPLYWEQYANHQHPERNARSNAKVELLEERRDRLVLKCTGSNRSNDVISTYILELTCTPEKDRYRFRIAASLAVRWWRKWLVTHNPSHGELEFCNLWPLDTFTTAKNARKRYQACYVARAGHVKRIPHHHLETSDKHNIRMSKGDSFFWLLEDENPVVEILSPDEVSAGLCAYMWDAHFAYRVCHQGQDVYLKSRKSFSAEFRIYSIDHAEGRKIVEVASEPVLPEIGEIPIYVDGINTFSKTLFDFRDRQQEVWPWATEVIAGRPEAARFTLDRTVGYRDGSSLRIDNRHHVTSRWIATTLGSAFGQPPFQDGARYRLSAYVRAEDVQGEATLAIRLHREGWGDVFNMEDYEVIYAPRKISGSQEWMRLEVVTPRISPAPDRVHLILQQSGMGTCWFDDVLFEPGCDGNDGLSRVSTEV